MKFGIFIGVITALSALIVEAALVSVSSTHCDQKNQQHQTINACNMSGMTLNVSGGGSVVFGGCSASISAGMSSSQSAACSSSAS